MELNSELDRLRELSKYIPFEKALQEAKTKHPNYPKDINKRTLILIEEAGEVAKAVLKLQDEGGSKMDILEELCQTGAMCMRMYESLIKNKETWVEKAEKVEE